ncbi:uncharacterized protein [Palaemon carinicauda]|uniref:uncharacterized protein n=1 Tax=Palaemon carinicauda TaxID=392227 RepID=UPI0035B61DEF
MEKMTIGFYWILLATLTLDLVILTEGQNLLKDAPLHYIKGGDLYPRSIKSEGFIISLMNAYWEGPVESECACRVTCWTHVECAGFSAHKEGDMMLCRLTILPPNEINFEENPSSTYTFWMGSVASILYQMFGGYMYLVPVGNRNFPDSKAYCESIPGHRLGIFQTPRALRSLEKVMTTTGLELWTDLHNSPDGPIWGDGVFLDFDVTLPIFEVSYSLMDTSPIRIRPPGVLDDNPSMNIRGFVCQASFIN